MEIEQKPLSLFGKFLYFILIFGIILLWIVGIYGYVNLPNRIPTHFGLNGEPNAYGSKIVFLILPICFTIAPAVLVLAVKFRFTLVNKYPYFINLPAFFTNLSKLPSEKRGDYINAYFELILLLGVALTYFFVGIEYWIYISTIKRELNPIFTPIILLVVIAIIAGYIVALRNLSKKFEKELP